jgi:hypothetical protein
MLGFRMPFYSYHPRDISRWATAGCSEVDPVGAGEASGTTSRRSCMIIQLSAVPSGFMEVLQLHSLAIQEPASRPNKE